MTSPDDTVRLDIRLSGQIQRYHTWPTIRKQTIAEHCWQILRIYFSVVDKVNHHMVTHIMFHDIGETAIGDLPYPVKSENHDLKKQLDYIEQKSCLLQLRYWNAFRPILFTEEDAKLFKDIELVEMGEFGLDEMCLGNSHAFIVADRCLKKVYHNEPCARLIQYIMKRLDIFHSQYKNELSEPLGDWWFAIQWRNKLMHGVQLNLEKSNGSE